MATQTPDYLVEWATNSDSELTDPGATLKANGWTVGDAPASSHFNYILHAAAGFSKFLPIANASQMAWGNIDYSSGYTATAGSPWGDTSSHFSVIYSKAAGRWYVLRKDSGTSKLVLLDSTTGGDGTWTENADVLGVTVTHTPYREFSLPVVGKGRLALAGGAGWLAVSSDTTVGNLQAATQPFNSITTCRGLAFDAVSGIWAACGSDGSAGYIEYSSDLVNWAVAASATTAAGDEYTCIAARDEEDGGGFFACTEDGTVNKFSANGSTWFAGPNFGALGTDDITALVYSKALGAFLCVRDSPNEMLLVEYGDTSYTTPGFTMGLLAMTDEFVWTVDPTSEHGDALLSFGDNVETQPLGEWLIGKAWSFVGAGSVCIGGQGKLIMPWTGEQKAVAYYGAQKENR